MKRLLLILLVTTILFEKNAQATAVNFYHGNFTSAKQAAASEGKLMFVDFTASWCLPCQMMDQTTFNDETLAAYIRDSYIPVKVDIDDFDGFTLKEQYDIAALPSILIFNSAGQLLDRHAEAMSASKMREVLARYDHPENKRITSIVPSRPTGSIDGIPAATPAPPVVVEQPIERPPVPTSNTPVPAAPVRPAPSYTIPDVVETAPTYDPVPTPAPSPAPIPTPAPMPAPGPTHVPAAAPEVMPVGEGLFKFTVTRQASSGYSVQIGAFGHYGNVLQEVEKLQQSIGESILVNIGSLRGKTVYKILLGEFSNRQAAIDYNNYLSGIGIQGLVKDLTLMK